MEVLSELKKQKEQLLIDEIEFIVEKLRSIDPSSDEFTLLLSSMKRKINQMSDQ